MTKHEGYPVSAEEKARQTLDKMAGALAEAVVAVEPANSGASPLEIFPEPGERRADTEYTLDTGQETALREAMAKLGVGRETNLTASEAGLRNGYVAIIEGGQAHKMLAEIFVVLSDATAKPSAIIIAATPERAIPATDEDKAKEREITARVLGLNTDSVGPTEYDVAQQVAYKIPRMQPRPVEVLHFGYSIEGEVQTESKTGQLKNLGFVDHITPVHLLRVDREYPDPDDPKKYNTLGPAGLMKVINNFLAQLPESEDREVGFVISSTYQPSRETDAVMTMLELERVGKTRNIGVVTYGTHELADVKGEDPSQPPLGQVASEAHKAAVELQRLRQILEVDPTTPEQ